MSNKVYDQSNPSVIHERSDANSKQENSSPANPMPVLLSFLFTYFHGYIYTATTYNYSTSIVGYV